MPDFITLSCPSCGAALKVTEDLERFACAHCGAEHIVRHSEGIVSLAPVIDGLARVGEGVDKAASELAIVRLKREIEDLKAEVDTLSNLQIKTWKFHVPAWALAAVGLYLIMLAADQENIWPICPGALLFFGGTAWGLARGFEETAREKRAMKNRILEAKDRLRLKEEKLRAHLDKVDE